MILLHENQNRILRLCLPRLRKQAHIFSEREFSSKKQHSLSYLQNWVGTGVANATTGVNTSSTHRPLQIIVSSYLLPTVCLPRESESSSVSESLSSFFSSQNSNHAIKSMLKSKNVPGRAPWKVPIILDLSAFRHDGSPHFKSPTMGFLRNIITAFDQWGITVMGLTNVQSIENIGDEVSRLGIPVLGRVGTGRTLGKKNSSSIKDNNDVDLDDLIQLVMKKNIENDSTIIEEGDERVGDEQNEIGSGPHSHDEIIQLSYRDKQSKCKSLGLNAGGSAATLEKRLMDYYGYKCDEVQSEHAAPELEANQIKVDKQTNIMDTMLVDNMQSLTPPKVYHGSVRSGQQVATDGPNQSLIIIGNVSSGGEVMADGNIYIFGALRGRALAGLSQGYDNEEISRKHSFKIVCSTFDAELVCIGNNFTTVDSVENLGLNSGSGALISSDDENGSLKFVKF